MACHKRGDDFEFTSDFLDSYIDSGVGVIHLKDKVFEMGIDFSLASVLSDSLSIAAESEEIKVVFLTSNPPSWERRNLTSSGREYWHSVTEPQKDSRSDRLTSWQWPRSC
jgi:hypothetical protein